MALYASRTRRSYTIAEELRRQIFNGELKPGDKLPTEMELCQTFHVSRATLREAVQMLRGNNQLEVTPGRGSFVLAPNLAAIAHDLTRVCAHKPPLLSQQQKLQGILFEETLQCLENLTYEEKKELSSYTLSPNFSTEDNVQIEMNWQIYMARLAENPMLQVFIHTLLLMDKPRRISILSKDQALLETINLQNSINTAIMAGKSSLAADLFSTYVALE
jgi:DNA-binding FadR family transcriptional regulator